MPEDAVQPHRGLDGPPGEDARRENAGNLSTNRATRGYDCVAAVVVDEQGYSLPESHIRIAGDWINQHIEGEPRTVLTELGLAGNYRQWEGSDVLVLTLTDSVRLAETSPPAQALSTDARHLHEALSGMAHGLNRVVGKRVRAMMMLHSRVRPMKNLTQSGRYSGPLCPPYRFGIAISRN